MKLLKILNIKLKHIFEILCCPSDWFEKKENNKTFKKIYGIFMYLFMGFCFQHYWYFPYFWEFSIAFIIMGSAAFFCIYIFSEKMTTITSEIINQDAARKANALFYGRCKKSVAYILFPLLIVIIFECGGCYMFGALQVNPTLIWVLSLFSLVVYISIIGYLQYIVLAIYICGLATGSGLYHNLQKTAVDCVPTELEWLQNLTKLYHVYRSAFFSLGSAYIIAFGAFCWLPEMNADTSKPIFILLWGIITVAIVFVFPVITLLEYKWIKVIVNQLKKSYINDLSRESQIVFKAGTLNASYQKLIETLYATQILNSKDYPVNSIWNTSYTVCVSVFNLFAAVITVLQAIPMLSNGFLQIF